MLNLLEVEELQEFLLDDFVDLIVGRIRKVFLEQRNEGRVIAQHVCRPEVRVRLKQQAVHEDVQKLLDFVRLLLEEIAYLKDE